MLSNIIYFVITLGVLVAFHEWGHFWVARRCGVFVQRFSVGFGSPLKTWRDKLGTEYVIAAIPLGGYVKMLDTRNETVSPADLDKTFNSRSTAQKLAIVAAGPLANFVLAFLVYYLIFIMGVPGIKPYVGEIEPDSVAYQAGLVEGEEIVAIDGQPVASAREAHFALVKRMGDTGTLRITTASPGVTETGQVVSGSLRDERTYDLALDRWLAGSTDPEIYRTLGFSYWRPSSPALIHSVDASGPAYQAGLMAGDQVVAINDLQINSWSEFVEVISARAGEQVTITVDREGDWLERSLKVRSDEVDGVIIGRIGVRGSLVPYPDSLRIVDRSSPIGAVNRALAKTGDMIVTTLESLVKMVRGDISPRNLGGPITIAQVASDSAKRGLVDYLQILALLSVSLGILNLLPVPMLDGGQLIFISAEGLMGKPVPMSVQIGAQQLGLILILSLMVFAIFNDFTRLL